MYNSNTFNNELTNNIINDDPSCLIRCQKKTMISKRMCKLKGLPVKQLLSLKIIILSLQCNHYHAVMTVKFAYYGLACSKGVLKESNQQRSTQWIARLHV